VFPYSDTPSSTQSVGGSRFRGPRGRAVPARHIRNKRLYDALDHWAFCALQSSPGARDFYDHHRAAGDLHHQALRALGNRLVGILHGCLRHHTHYDEHKAWAHRQTAATA
jgi:hypothetical protein